MAALIHHSLDLLGGMLAVVAVLFTLKETREESLSAGISRLIATGVSFALCLVYLLFFPFHAEGMALLIGIATVIMIELGRRSEIVTAGITISVVMIVLVLSPAFAWHQPLMRLLDTAVSIVVALMFAQAGSFLFGLKPE